MDTLQVAHLTKRYPGFTLDDVSFTVRAGTVMGFIGRNGAGKTTTLKSLTNLVHPDAGEIRFFGKALAEDEAGLKQKIGFVSGGTNYYPLKKLALITRVTKRFYRDWDEAAYARCMRDFALDPNKTPAQLSAGMNVKYALTLALSHNAELLILDEPTSGLDPVSRDELLGIFLDLARAGKSILFSTHITSDLDKCADDITYIQNGKIRESGSIDAFVGRYRIALFPDKPDEKLLPKLIGCREEKRGYPALVRAEDAAGLGVPVEHADLERIMVHMERV